jgi:hypothetical protein
MYTYTEVGNPVLKNYRKTMSVYEIKTGKLCNSEAYKYSCNLHWHSGMAQGCLPQGCGFVSQPVDWTQC